MRERGEHRDGRHDHDDGSGLAAPRRSRDEHADPLREARGAQCRRDDEHGCDDDGRLAGESGQRFDGREDAGEAERQHRDHRRDVDAHAFADEQRERAGENHQNSICACVTHHRAQLSCLRSCLQLPRKRDRYTSVVSARRGTLTGELDVTARLVAVAGTTDVEHDSFGILGSTSGGDAAGASRTLRTARAAPRWRATSRRSISGSSTRSWMKLAVECRAAKDLFRSGAPAAHDFHRALHLLV